MASQKKRADARSAPREAPPPSPPSVSRPSARSTYLFAAALFLLTLLAYSNSFHDGYTLDNNQILRADTRIQKATSDNVDLILHHTYWWPYGESGLYRPLATLSYMFNYAVLGNGEHSAGYHCINLLLHLANILLVYLLALKLLRARGRAFAVAVLWAVHPVLTESVTNMVGRPDLLAGIGVLGGFLFYLIATESTGNRRWAALGGAAAATVIGAFSKESGVTVAGVIAIYEVAFWNERRQVKGRLAGCLAVGIPILAMLYQRMQVLSAAPAASFPFLDNPLVDAGFLQGRLTALAVLARYLWRLVCPITLSADYSYAQILPATGTLTDWLCWLVVAGLAVAVIASYRWNRTVFFFAGFAAVTLLPGSNLLFPIGTIMAERFLYLPAIAFCVCVVLGLETLPPSMRVGAPVIVCLLAGAYAVRTWVRNPDWSDDLHMAMALVKTSPNSFKVRKMLAFHLYHADPTHANLDQVIDQSEKGLAILDPVPNSQNNPEAYRFAAGYYLEKGDMARHADPNGGFTVTPESRQAYQKGLRLLNRAIAIMGWANQDLGKLATAHTDAAAGDAFRVLSLIDQRMSDGPQAYDNAIRAQLLDPVNPDIYLQLARVLIQSNQVDAAAIALLEGTTLTRDKRLSNELLRLYQGPLDSGGCAIQSTASGTALNPRCESVKRLLCPAVASAVSVRMRTGRADLAQELSRVSQQEYGCPSR